MLKRLPIHTWLVPVFFVLHAVNKYYALIPVGLIAEFMAYYLLLSAILLGAGRLLYKQWIKAGLWATLLLIAFFFYGAMHDFLKDIFGKTILTSYTLLLPVSLLGLIGCTWLLKKRTKHVDKASNYLSVLFVLLCGVELATMTYRFIMKTASQINPPFIVKADLKAGTPPDIFFVVFDEYASSKSLLQYSHFDNSKLDSALHNNHFYTAAKSKSNYNYTPYSISSAFNLHYFNRELSADTLTLKTWLQGWYALQNSRVPQWLAARGYQVHNYSIGDLKHFPAQATTVYYPHQRKLLYSETMWGRIEKDIWWNIYKLSWFKPRFHQNLQRNARQTIDRNRLNYQSLLKELRTQSDQPKFVYAHMMLPHGPFLLNYQGKMLPAPLLTTAHQYQKDRYLEQLIYSNTWIDSIIQASNQPYPRPRMVIIEGDHGYRDTSLTNARDIHFMNLNTYYFSDHEYSMLYDSISPVNTFRVAFNKYFHTQLPLLKDSSIYTP